VLALLVQKSAAELVAALRLKGVGEFEEEEVLTYSLYWYKSTNTDAEGGVQARPLPFSRPRDNEKVFPCFFYVYFFSFVFGEGAGCSASVAPF
jgi:hypothetical protein